jgi:paraquat-inducible protein B
MNDTDRGSPPREDRSTEARRAQAGVRRGWWPGWIWAIPIAVLVVLVWLGARVLLSGGETITISFEDAHGMKAANTDVVYRGTQIGQVTKVALNESGTASVVTASIDQSAVKFLRAGTRFWLQGASPSLENPQSLASILSGPTIVLDPGSGAKAKHFVGLERKPISSNGAERPVVYGVSLDGDVGALKSGDTVKLRGFTVGEVRSVGFSYDARTGALSTPATIALYPSLLHIEEAANPASPQALHAAIDTLIREGLRARLDRDPPLVGSFRVSLEMVPGAPAAEPASIEGVPQLPAAMGGGLSSLATRLEKIPIEKITQNILDITHHLDTVVANPKLKDAVVQLDAALKQIKTTMTKAGPQITTLTTTLRKAADQLDEATGSANKLMSGTATQEGLGSTVQEITEAAQAVRSLADYLDRHPESLIKGRTGEEP